jgi:hypothetical protein
VYDMTFNPVHKIQCLILAPKRSMGNENYKVVTHNLDVSPEGPIVLSFEFQLNLWDVCGLMTFPGSEVNDMNF